MTLGMARPHAQVAHSRENTAAGNSLVNHHAIHGTLEGPDTGAICRKWRIQRHRQRVKEPAGDQFMLPLMELFMAGESLKAPTKLTSVRTGIRIFLAHGCVQAPHMFIASRQF